MVSSANCPDSRATRTLLITMNRTQLLTTLGGAALVGVALTAQNPGPAGNNWPHHLGDQGGTRFSTLNQINVSNVSNLKRAWTFKTGSGRFAELPDGGRQRDVLQRAERRLRD